jgi:hypothetical protein
MAWTKLPPLHPWEATQGSSLSCVLNAERLKAFCSIPTSTLAMEIAPIHTRTATPKFLRAAAASQCAAHYRADEPSQEPWPFCRQLPGGAFLSGPRWAAYHRRGLHNQISWRTPLSASAQYTLLLMQTAAAGLSACALRGSLWPATSNLPETRKCRRPLRLSGVYTGI